MLVEADSISKDNTLENNQSKKKKEASSNLKEVEKMISCISSYKGVLSVTTMLDTGSIIYILNNEENG